MDVSFLPAVNATLNGTCAVLLLTGRRFIRNGRRKQHKQTMISAFCVSAIFLACYLTYHAFHGITIFHGPDWARYLYLTILGTHTILAVVVLPMIIITLTRGLKNRVPQHRKIAKWTYPVWLYVSVTGVVVYVMLYQIFV